jgi:hypothetical protein
VSLRIASAAVAADQAFHPRRASAGAATVSGVAQGEFVDVAFEPIREKSLSLWMTSPADAAAEVSVTLATERRAELGGYDHRHLPGACGFCRRAAAAYR